MNNLIIVESFKYLSKVKFLFITSLALLCDIRKMTNLDSILKSTDITLPTNAKAMGFPVIMYGCESWTVKKTECQRIDTFELWCWRRLLRVPLGCKEIKPVNPKGNQI